MKLKPQSDKKNKIKLYDTAIVVEIYEDGKAYEMEFFDKKGNTIGVYTVILQNKSI